MASSIKFARFKNATLELFEAPIESTDYIAFSHVWGNWAWRSTDGIPYEIKASEEKAHFIANDLPALVGDGAFWMDTLTVDQRNPAEVSEIVDKIPTIFRMAKKTIAVREYPVSGWLPSQHLPSPTTLGDFLKLVGQRVPENSKVSSQHVHVTSVVHIEEFECEGSPDFVIALLEACLRNFQGQWQESHQGGELSKYGPYPSVNWALDSLDALRCGWLHTDPEHAIRVYENNDQSWIRIGPGLEYEEDDLLLGLRSLDETEQGARTDETNNVASLFVQARKILDNMWCAHDPHYISASQKADWATFKQQMQGSWSKPLLRTVLLLAAMVNCRVPLSAAAWVNKLFVPVYIHHGKFLLSVGLLAKHARQPKHQRQQPDSLLCVGQHLPSSDQTSDQTAFGKDLYLVDAKSKVPVSLVPDLMPDDPTDEKFAKVSCVMYNGFCKYMGNNQVAFAAYPLSRKYNEVSNANPPIHAQTADELWSHIMRFTNDLPVDRTTNAYDAWPFVELVSIGGPFAVLERNIIQADTPGQDDIDLIAETSVMSYLLRCTIVIVAHKIDRILSTRSLQKMIRASFMQEQNDRCCTDIFERSYFRDEMSKVYDKSHRTRPIPGQTVKLAQMEMFEQLLCDANTNPFKAVYTRLGEAIVSEKQRVKDLLEEHVGALFRSIEEEFERSREVGVALTNEEAQIMDDLLNSRVTAAKVRGILEEKLKECGVDVEAIKAEFTERQSL
ncbi:unnamed protein product [Alternaria alternata]